MIGREIDELACNEHGNALCQENKAKLKSLLKTETKKAEVRGRIDELRGIAKAQTRGVYYQYNDGSRVVVEQRIKQLQESEGEG